MHGTRNGRVRATRKGPWYRSSTVATGGHRFPEEPAAGGTYHLEERQVTGENVIEVYVRVNPCIVEVGQRQALRHVVDDRSVHNLLVLVHALEVAAAEQVDAHYAEDKPEDEAHNQHVEDGRDRLDERVHNHLSIKIKRRLSIKPAIDRRTTGNV